MKDKRGFTLIEVISVLVILGLLATIIVTQYATTIKESRKKLNEEQKSRLVEVAKNVSLNNKTCLEIAKNNPEEGVKITIDQMRQNGYIANTQLKNLEDSTILNSCVILKWDSNYNKFDYSYSEDCSSAQTCVVTAESEKVIVSSFYVGENNTNYTNKRDVTYYVRYSTGISAEYCVTLENEASCRWKKLETSNTSISGNLNLTEVENIVHLYIRNNNKNIIASIDDSIIFDSSAPTCTWKTPSNSYVRNGSSSELVLSCSDVAGIKNTELLSSAININNSEMISLSDAIVTTNGTNKDFKFIVYGLEGNGSARLSLKPGVISDTSGNFVTIEYTSPDIHVDNIAPTGNVILDKYTNSERITLNFTGVSSDVEKMCVSNSSEGNCNYVNYAPTYNWTLSGSDGIKTIYVSLVDRAGNVMNKSVSIHFDKISPNCIATPTSGNFNLKNGSYIEYLVNCTDNNKMSDNTSIDLSMFLIDKQGDSDVSLSIVGSNKDGTTIRVQALNGNGRSIVTLKPGVVFDEAGNSNKNTEIANVIVDNIPPVNNSIIINYNSTITHLRNVTLQLNSEIKSEGGGYYCLTKIDNISSCSDSNWISYSSIGSFMIGSQVGTHTIYAFFKDVAGNISPTSVSDSIKYNQEAISCVLTSETDSILINYSDASKLADLPYSQDMTNWNNNNVLPKQDGKYRYFSYIKDKNGEINYCELNIPN